MDVQQQKPKSATDRQPDRESIRLDQFLKVQQLVPSGGAAKWAIQGGNVKVNGQIEVRRGRQLFHGDRVEFETRVLPVVFETD